MMIKYITIYGYVWHKLSFFFFVHYIQSSHMAIQTVRTYCVASEVW